MRRAREIFLSIEKPYLYKIDAARDEKEICTDIIREFSLRYTEWISKSGMALQDQLSETLRLFGQGLD